MGYFTANWISYQKVKIINSKDNLDYSKNAIFFNLDLVLDLLIKVILVKYLMIIPVVITVYADRSFSFITKTPPAPVLLLKAANVAKGSGEPNRNKVG